MHEVIRNNFKYMTSKKSGYIVPIAIGILVVASLGLLLFSWLAAPSKSVAPEVKTTASSTNASNTAATQASANDNATLDNDSAAIDAQIKALDSNNADVNAGINDTSSI